MRIDRIIRILAVTAVVAIASTVSASAQNGRGMGGLNIGFDGDYFHISASYHYMLCPYAGLGLGVGYDGYTGGGWNNVGWGPGFDDYGSRDYSRSSFYAEPSVYLTTGNLLPDSSPVGLGISARPAVRFSTNHYGKTDYWMNGQEYTAGYKYDTTSFSMTIGPTIYIGPTSITVGYYASTLARSRTYDPATGTFHKKITQGIVVEAGFSF